MKKLIRINSVELNINYSISKMNECLKIVSKENTNTYYSYMHNNDLPTEKLTNSFITKTHTRIQYVYACTNSPEQ